MGATIIVCSKCNAKIKTQKAAVKGFLYAEGVRVSSRSKHLSRGNKANSLSKRLSRGNRGYTG